MFEVGYLGLGYLVASAVVSWYGVFEGETSKARSKREVVARTLSFIAQVLLFLYGSFVLYLLYIVPAQAYSATMPQIQERIENLREEGINVGVKELVGWSIFIQCLLFGLFQLIR